MSQDEASKQHREISAAQVEPLERAIPGDWPHTWRDFALSVFTTLVVLRNWTELPGEVLAVEVVKGIGQDLGGSQPYIPVGLKPTVSERNQEVLNLLAAGKNYRQAALKVGLTESQVRKIERQGRWARRAAKKGRDGGANN